MPDDPKPGDGGEESQQESLRRFIEATVDERIQASQVDQNNTRRKKWKNSWRSAGPITKGSFMLTAAVAAATVAYAIIAYREFEPIRKSAEAAQDAAYASCRGAKVANSSLLEYQKSARDSHLASVAAYAQAIAAIESQKTFVAADFEVPDNRPYDRPIQIALTLKNMGKSDASSISIAGWAIVARPNDHLKLPQKSNFSIQIKFIRAGDKVLTDSPNGQPARKFRIPIFDETGKIFIDTAQLDKEIFLQHGKYVFIYYEMSYDDFSAHYVRKVCEQRASWLDSEAAPMLGQDVDKQCTAYNTQTETAKIPMPPLLNEPSSIVPSTDIVCRDPKEEK